MEYVKRLKFGDNNECLCENCNEKILYKNKSNYLFFEDNNNYYISCYECFFGKINIYHKIPNNHKTYIPSNIININSITECNEKMPSRFYMWKILHKKDKILHCPICYIELIKKNAYTWYIQLPKEGGNQNISNFNLVCENCQLNLLNREKGIISFNRKYLKNNNYLKDYFKNDEKNNEKLINSKFYKNLIKKYDLE